jgi:hypothetical protein
MRFHFRWQLVRVFIYVYSVPISKAKFLVASWWLVLPLQQQRSEFPSLARPPRHLGTEETAASRVEKTLR